MKRMISHVGGLIAGLQSYSRTAVVFKLALLVSGLLCFYQIVEAAPRLSRKPTAGVPTAEVTLNGSGFSAYEAVDVYFDTEDLRLCATNARGEFSCTLQVPREANSGIHWLTAVGRQSGRAAQKSFTVRVNWSQFHYGSGHRGYNPYENLISVDNVADLNVAWSFATEDSISSSPALNRGVIYAASNSGRLYAINAATGTFKRIFEEGRFEYTCSPAVANGMVFVPYDFELSAIDASTGEIKWSGGTGVLSSSPAVANGILYIRSMKPQYPEPPDFQFKVYDVLYAINANNGEYLFTYTIDSTGGGSHGTSPSVAYGMVYVGFMDGKLYALDAATGDLKWSRAMEDPFSCSPVVANGVVYVGSDDGTLYALNAATGELKWCYTTGGGISSSPAVANGVVYVGSGDAKFYALAAATGELKWCYTTGGGISSSPAVANGVVYLGSADSLFYALNAATGELKWSFITGDRIDSSPVVANGMVYVGSNDGKLYCFSLDPGWEFDREILRPDPATLIPDERLELQVEK